MGCGRNKLRIEEKLKMKIIELIKQHEEAQESISKIAFEHLNKHKEYYGEDAEKVTWLEGADSLDITLKGEESWSYGGYDSWTVCIEVKDMINSERVEKKIIENRKEKKERDKKIKSVKDSKSLKLSRS